jgi:hypothetical protein
MRGIAERAVSPVRHRHAMMDGWTKKVEELGHV